MVLEYWETISQISATISQAAEMFSQTWSENSQPSEMVLETWGMTF
jgi:hypothetical protein